MIRSDQTHLPVVARTHPGMTGKNNEDRYAVSAFRLNSNRATPTLLAVLSDGIGGHRSGEVAAEIAVTTIGQKIAQSTPGDPVHILQEAVQDASQEIYQRAQSDANHRGMGATCVAVWIIGSRVFSATVGDSRLYLLRGDSIHQLSTDHTWVQEAVERGYLQPDQVKGHPNAHIIRRYLGSPTPSKVDIRLRLNGHESDSQAEANQGMLLRGGDRLLLCTDGLTDLVEDTEILNAFRTLSMDDAAEQLVNLANQRGGHDNITLIAIEVPGVRVPVVAPKPRRVFSMGCLGAVVAALVVAVLAMAWLWFFQGWRLFPVVASTTPTVSSTQAGTLPVVLSSVPSSPTPTLTPTVPPEIFGTDVPAATATRSALLPLPGASTLTPWPTNTPRPTFTRTPTATP